MSTMTRRTFIGGAAIATAGAGAVLAGDTTRGRRWLHTAGLIDGPDLAIPEVDAPPLVEHRSDRFRGGHWAVAAPARASAILVALHGRNNDHRHPFESIGLHRFLASAGLPWAAVGVTVGTDSYWHRRRDGTDGQGFVFEEVVPSVRRSTGDLPLVLIGWSMGGFGALLAAREHPGAVAGVAVSAPALWDRFEDTAPGAFDDRRDFDAHDIVGHPDALVDKAVRIDCGTEDPFLAMSRRMAEAIGATAQFDTGFHETATWRSHLPDQLRFLREAIT